MLEGEILTSLRRIDPAEWNAVFQGVEGYDYLSAVERAGIEGFCWRYVLVREDGELVAAAPAFLTGYALETTLTGFGRRLLAQVRRVAPGVLTLRLACIGSPCLATAGLGFAPGLAEDRRPAVLHELLRTFEREASAERCGLVAVKDVTAPEKPLWDTATAPRGYGAMASLPIASLDIDFITLDEYLARLTSSARKDMRRKLRARERVRVEIRSDVNDLADQLMALYADTRARAEMSFEDLTADYFTGVPQSMGDRAFYVLYFLGDDLLAANLLLQDEATLVDKYFLMDAERGRPLNLYFLSWFTNVELCLARGLRRYQSGQAAYGAKLRLGSQLTRTSIYFRHRNALMNGVMQLFAPLFAADPTIGHAA